jgi:hypothetical protein
MTSFACVPHAIAPAIRDEHFKSIAQLFGELAREKCVITDGYRYRFDSSAFATVASFIANERLCCPFLAFSLSVTPDAGPIWLQVSGPEGTPAFLDAEFR